MSSAMQTLNISLSQLQTRFLALLPAIQKHAKFYFRDIVCPDRRADKISEVIAIAWRWFLRLAARGRDAAEFPTVLARYAARAVRSGRRICGQERANDVLSSTAQQHHGFTVGSIPDGSSLAGNVFDEALRDNTVTPPPEQAAFRIDFPRWRLTFVDRDRQIIDGLAVGERTMDLSQQHGVSPGRISQMRRQFHHDWQRFHGEAASSALQPNSV